ncbi:MAG: metallophosphoesterase family protein [Candidatus Hydrogenedentes bacterium]|nr:metallophosphoesterase family protein [Candidatus Hydrogenedentota bacterium]
MRKLFLLALLLACALPLRAHVGTQPSIHDTVSGIITRWQNSLPAETLTALTVPQALEQLTAAERSLLSTTQLTFKVDVPVVVTVFRETAQKEVVFWLAERGFTKPDQTVTVERDRFEAWQLAFPAGEIGLGVNSLSGDGDQYFVALAPQTPGTEIHVSDIYPGQHTLGKVELGERAYAGWDERIFTEVAEAFKGQTLLRGDMDHRRTAKLIGLFRVTDYPATETPDQVVLTWAGDPMTTQSIQWRTSTKVAKGTVRYREKAAAGTEASASWTTVTAQTKSLKTPGTVNDSRNHRHTANLVRLKPGATYEYEVDNGPAAEFTTAPAETVPFKFVYMGDAQNGLDDWGKLVHHAYTTVPEAAFYIMAGDLVNRGNERDDWDSFFHNATGVFDRRQLVPCIGNHECQGDQGPWMYLSLFNLPLNGPADIEPERAYTFTYSNALFAVLDSNMEPETQSAWLDQQLAQSDKTWKFVVYHHPAYSSGPDRNNQEVREQWGALFDKYHVDLALQGHDHAYLRTWPMKNQQRVGSAAEGTIYIVSVSGTKFYEQGSFDYTEFGMTNVATYQVLDLQIDGNKLTYKAYDIEGKVRDEFVIEK